jgi:hypothetical protein
MTQIYTWPKYKRGIGQINNSTWPAYDEQQEVLAGYTDPCQMVNYEVHHKYDLKDHKRWCIYVIAWVGGL